MKRTRFEITTEYLSSVYNTSLFVKKVNQLARKIKAFRKRHQIDAIAFTGQSGSAFAYAISYKIGIPLVCIRKRADNSHYGRGSYEGRRYIKKYIIVDDFIETGSTIDTIKRHVQDVSPKAKLMAIFLYGGNFDMDELKGVPVFDL